MDEDTKSRIDRLERDLFDLTNEVYKNNFSANQDFNKASSFSTKLKIPHYDNIPGVCETGDLIEVRGKLYICSTNNTFSLVGTQS